MSTYDQRCADLARFFLEDQGARDGRVLDDEVAELAGDLQRLIEDYLDERPGGAR